MMTNLFSIFDPSTSFAMKFNWLSIPVSLMIFPLKYWILPSRSNFMINKIISIIFKEIFCIMKTPFILPFITIFLFILLNNLLGLLPYSFTATSHMSLNSYLALYMWLIFILFIWKNNFTHFMAHLVPKGTPTSLLLFMSLIELIITLIRPMTLAIRLTANMIAGHLLISLLNSMGPFIPSLLFIFPQIMLLILEVAVAIIQAYVFTILITLYASEV